MISLADSIEEAINQAGDLIDLLGPENIFLSIIFICSFALSFKAFSKLKIFQDEYEKPKSIAGIIAFVLSVAIAWLVNQTGIIDSLNPEGIFDYLGYSDGALATIIPLIFIIIFIYMIAKIGPSFLIAAGIILIGISNTSFIYSAMAGMVTGSIISLIGILWLWRRNKKKKEIELGIRSSNNLNFGLMAVLIIGVIGAILLIPFSSITSIIIFAGVCIVALIIWLTRKNKTIASTENKSDWPKYVVPFIMVAALLVFIIFSSFSFVSEDSILGIILAVLVGVILIIWFLRKNWSRGKNIVNKGQQRFSNLRIGRMNKMRLETSRERDKRIKEQKKLDEQQRKEAEERMKKAENLKMEKDNWLKKIKKQRQEEAKKREQAYKEAQENLKR